MNLLTPFGVNDLKPNETEAKKTMCDAVNAIFKKYTFQEVQTPTIEYFDVLKAGFGSSLSEKAIKFFNQKGETLVLRPDQTTPIARLVATRMRHTPLPIKCAYNNPIFRNNSEENADIEIDQAGIEYIGENSPEADAHVIEVCIESLKALGLNEFNLSIGHTSFTEGLNDEQKHALLTGDYVSLGYIPKRGGEEIIADNSHLQAVHTILKEKGYERFIHYNKGLVKNLNYYTGIIFDCFATSSRDVIGSGGRYDQLLGKFGYDVPAVGFALNMTRLVQLGGQENG